MTSALVRSPLSNDVEPVTLEAPPPRPFSVGGIELAWSTAGRGSPVLLIHGLGSSQLDWSRQVPVLARTHHVVTYDQRGHGASSHPLRAFTMRDLALDAAVLIRRLGLARCHVVGLSLGGMVAFQLAVDEPELVRSLVIVNSGPEVVPRTLKERWTLLLRRALSRVLPMRSLAAMIVGRLFPHPEQQALRTEFVERFAGNHKPSYRKAMAAIIGWSVSDRIGTVTHPVLVVTGDRDYTTVDRKRQYVDRLPRATLAVVENSGHATPIDQASAFNELVLRFLADVDEEVHAVRVNPLA
jgi:pimeloyl-ACP methyl ester carboxylesterase